jgi:hypothetical protein
MNGHKALYYQLERKMVLHPLDIHLLSLEEEGGHSIRRDQEGALAVALISAFRKEWSRFREIFDSGPLARLIKPRHG